MLSANRLTAYLTSRTSTKKRFYQRGSFADISKNWCNYKVYVLDYSQSSLGIFSKDEGEKDTEQPIAQREVLTSGADVPHLDSLSQHGGD